MDKLKLIVHITEVVFLLWKISLAFPPYMHVKYIITSSKFDLPPLCYTYCTV